MFFFSPESNAEYLPNVELEIVTGGMDICFIRVRGMISSGVVELIVDLDKRLRASRCPMSGLMIQPLDLCS